jgi:two-component system, NtrC family, response regulator AtoC
LPKILWLTRDLQSQDIQALERKTGLKIAVSDGPPAAWRRIAERVKVILIELPDEASRIQETLIEAYSGPIATPVIIYDKEGTLDESLIGPPMTAFRHVTGRLTVDQLSVLIGSAMEQFAQHVWDTGEPAESWKNLLIGESQPMKSLHAMIRLVSPRQSTVLITGETGTGKEMVARAIHTTSKRSASRMVAVNCAAIPENLVEAELFGHSKGAFTGAVNDRVGRFEQAHRGTLFLDEIGELPLPVQPKLLRVLQERELSKVGSSGTIQIDTRVIAASNIDLQQAVADRRFREDLLYRLNVVPIHLPPLRERASDIPLLAGHFIEKVCRREGLRPKTLTSDALQRLLEYEWPGNVRQLEHAIEMAVTLTGDRQQIYLGDIRLPRRMQGLPAIGIEPEINMDAGGMNFEEVMGRVEKLLLQAALRKCDGNKAKAASLLGIPRTTLLYKVKAAETFAI